MHSINEIIALNDPSSVKADAEKLQPLVASKDGDEAIFKCPNFGYYRPQGWKEVGTYFVNSSGFADEGGLALSPEKFQASVKKGYGYAIVDVGQFQIHIGEFKKN